MLASLLLFAVRILSGKLGISVHLQLCDGEAEHVVISPMSVAHPFSMVRAPSRLAHDRPSQLKRPEFSSYFLSSSVVSLASQEVCVVEQTGLKQMAVLDGLWCGSDPPVLSSSSTDLGFG